MSARGEGRLTVGGREVIVLFTNRALAAAETASGKSVMEMADAISRKDVSMGLLAALLQAGIAAARRDAGDARGCSLDEAYDVLDAVGFVTALVVVAQALADAFAWKPGVEGDPACPPA